MAHSSKERGPNEQKRRPVTIHEFSCSFGLRRAEAVMKLLMSMGVETAQLHTIGIGTVRTSVRSDISEENRTVWLVEADSSLADEFISLGKSL